MGTRGDRAMKNQFRLFSALFFFLFLFACAERTEIAPEGEGPVLPSDESSLSDLAIAGVTLDPEFDPATDSYTATVAYEVDSVSFTPMAMDTNATITVNGDTVESGSTSLPIALAEGDNTITVVVTAEDGSTTSTYVITITRASLSTDATLSLLAVSDGTLEPAFDSATLGYAVSVSDDIGSVTVTPTTTDANATVTVDGTAVASGSASGSIALDFGTNAIDVVVTAQDGVSTETYTVTVTRMAPPASTDASLSDLVLSTAALDQVFQSDSYTYTATVSYAVALTTVTPTTTDANAVVTVDGTAVASGSESGSIALEVGENAIEVIVTAEDGVTTETYTVTVTREIPPASTDASLAGLTLSAAALDQIFQSNSYTYTATVAYAMTSTTVTPTTNDANATVTVNGTAVASGSASGSIALAEGDNAIGVVVTAEDGATTQTYTVTVTRQSAEAFVQQAYVKASNTGPADAFGYSLAMDGDTLAVGAFQQGGSATSTPSFSGAVYVFTRTSGVWSQEAFIKASNAGYGYNFGAAVALQGDTLVVGEPNEGRTVASTSVGSGAAYVYVRSDGVWTEQAFLRASNNDDDDDFGYSVAVDGDTAVIGAPGEDSSGPGGEADNSTATAGAVYVFTRSGTNWTQQAYLKASNAGVGHGFGSAVDVELGTLVVGAPNENSGIGRGAVYVFSEEAGAWTEQAHVKGSYVNSFGDFTSRVSRFGHTVALSGDTVAVGAPNSNVNFGWVFVHTWTGTAWEQQDVLEPSNRAQYDVFGVSVSLSGDLLVAGAPGKDG